MIQITTGNLKLVISCDKIARKYQQILEKDRLYFYLNNEIVFMVNIEDYKLRYVRKLDNGKCLIFNLQEVKAE
jgi:hypothetical protein